MKGNRASCIPPVCAASTSPLLFRKDGKLTLALVAEGPGAEREPNQKSSSRASPARIARPRSDGLSGTTRPPEGRDAPSEEHHALSFEPLSALIRSRRP